MIQCSHIKWKLRTDCFKLTQLQIFTNATYQGKEPKKLYLDQTDVEVDKELKMYFLSCASHYQGRKILIVLETCRRQKGHLETADEHLRHNTWPHGTIVTSTSLLKQTRHDHAALAVSASLAAISDFSCNIHRKRSHR